MAIRINLESLEIPVQIGDFSFIVKIDDDSYQEMIDSIKDALDTVKDSKDLDEIGEALEKAYDSILGDDSFEKLYNEMKSIPILASVLKDLYFGIENEYHRRIQKNHVITNKKNKNVQHN